MNRRRAVGLSVAAVGLLSLAADFTQACVRHVEEKRQRALVPAVDVCKPWCACNCGQTGCGCHEGPPPKPRPKP